MLPPLIGPANPALLVAVDHRHLIAHLEKPEYRHIRRLARAIGLFNRRGLLVASRPLSALQIVTLIELEFTIRNYDNPTTFHQLQRSRARRARLRLIYHNKLPNAALITTARSDAYYAWRQTILGVVEMLR